MWLRHRSAPAPVWLAATLGMLVFATVFIVLDIFVLRPAREESAFTRGIPRATLSDPSPARAVYTVVLRANEDQPSPTGTRAVAYRWRVSDPRTPQVAVCQGEHTRAIAVEDSRRVTVDLPLDEADWGAARILMMPRRLAAICAATAHGPLQYREWVVPDNVRADVVGCERRVDSVVEISDCNDNTASRIFLLPSRAVGRARARLALNRIAAAAVSFAVCAVIAGFSALKIWRKTLK